MEHLLLFALLLVWCLIGARFEVEIEGKDGWAKNLPTWKYRLDETGRLWYKPLGAWAYRPVEEKGSRYWFFSLCIKHILAGRDFTGYHRLFDLIQLFVMHLLVYLIFEGQAPWWILEARTLALFMVSWAVEDTLWFLVNPFFGPSRYKPEYIPWHAKDWWLIAPRSVIFQIVVGALLYGITFFP